MKENKMSTITCLKELKEKGELKYTDIVEFIVNKEILKYEVENSYLHYLKDGKNDEIFKILEIDKYILAKNIYKYKPTIKESEPISFLRIWPETKDHDYPALTRLVKELYRIIEGQETVYTKFTRFEIMDI